MKYAKYAEYKESEVEWLGEVPAHWVVKKLKFVALVQPSNVDKKSYDGETPVYLCNYTDVYYNEQITDALSFMKATASQEQIRKFTLKGGDTIITKDSEDPNDIAIPTYVPDDMEGVVCGYHLALLRAQNRLIGAYLKRTLDSHYARSLFATRAKGLTRYGLNTYAIKNFVLPLPSITEQQQITAFLDKETAKIDTLIEKQEQLIKLLQEKRQAVISHAVTKGLNPAAKMKDSGVEWLGEVPAHWAILRNRRVIKTIEQGWSPQADNRPPSVDEWGVTKLSSVKQGKFYPQESKTLYLNDDPSRGMIVKEGDFLITRANTPKLVGDVCVVPALQHKKLLLCDLIYRITFSENVEPQFLCAFFLSESGRTQVKMDARGASMSMAKISQGHIKDWLAPIPPIEEQIRIVDYLNSQTKKIDQTIDAAKQAIDLLKERRTALISAAVTGKIDVREAV